MQSNSKRILRDAARHWVDDIREHRSCYGPSDCKRFAKRQLKRQHHRLGKHELLQLTAEDLSVDLLDISPYV